MRLWAFSLPLLLAAFPAAAHHQGGDADDQDGPPHQGDEAEKPDPKKMASKMADGMSRGLKLKEDQKKKIETLVEQMLPQRIELEKKLHKLERDTNEKIRAVLDDDQKEKFDMMRMHQAMMRGGGMGMRGPGMKGMRGGRGRGGPEGGRRPPEGSGGPGGPGDGPGGGSEGGEND